MSSFVIRGGFVSFFSDQPGNHVTMFGPDGKSLAFQSDYSRFNDDERSYLWAFAYMNPIAPGLRFVFATSDREAVGEAISETEISLVRKHSIYIVRGAEGKPLRALGFSPPNTVHRQVVKPTAWSESARSTSTPKVSVITCSYNRPDFLRIAVASLRNQTDPDWEHLIYDDASTDPRMAEALSWAEQDPRVRVWRRTSNLNRPSVLWNFMMDRVRGRYLTVLDDDNEKLPRFVEDMSKELDADPALDLVTCGWMVQDDRDFHGSQEYHLNLSTCVPVLEKNSTCDGGAVLYRRSTFERAGYFSEALRTNEDWDWLRRAIHTSTFKNLHECFSTYRCHRGNRMLICESLGNASDVQTVRNRQLEATISVRTIQPPASRLTRSQQDVIGSLDRALGAIPWVVSDAISNDLALVISPFQLSPNEIKTFVQGARRTLSIHMEDPYALSANLNCVRGMTEACLEVWVCTNDAATVPFYRDVVGDRVLVCPSLGADSTIPVEPPAERDIDILLCGYAYPSRQRFVNALLPHLEAHVPAARTVLVGDGWEGYPCVTMPTQDLATTYALHARAKTVICLHRVHGDCSDGPVEPATVNRGFMEVALGPRVFLDRSRSGHPFSEGDVVWYNDPLDLAAKLGEYLNGPSYALAERCATTFTYRTRLARMINCVRAPRYLVEIP